MHFYLRQLWKLRNQAFKLPSRYTATMYIHFLQHLTIASWIQHSVMD